MNRNRMDNTPKNFKSLKASLHKVKYLNGAESIHSIPNHSSECINIAVLITQDNYEGYNPSHFIILSHKARSRY